MARRIRTNAYKRWIFWINIPFGVIALVAVPLFIRLAPVQGSMMTKLKRVDWRGNVLFTASITSFLMPITWGGTQYPWSSWRTLVPLVLGIVGLVLFSLDEIFLAKEPTVRLGLCRSFNMAYSLFATMINALIVYGALYFLPLYYEAVKGYIPLMAGVALLPATFTVAPVSIIAGFIIAKTNDFRILTWVGWAVATLGCGIVWMLDVDTTVVQWVFLTLVPGIGLGILYTSLTFVNQSACADTDMAFGVTLFVFFRCLGQCLGVAIGSAAFQNEMERRLRSLAMTTAQASTLAKEASGMAEMLRGLPDGEDKSNLRHAYTDALRVVWVIMCGLGGAAFLGALFIRRTKLRREHFTEQQLM